MGCDIHGMFEYKCKDGWWVNAGDPDVGRQYWLFGILAGVRGTYYPTISAPREPEGCCEAFNALRTKWGVGGHSASYVTLCEMMDYDIDVFDGDYEIEEEWDRLLSFGQNVADWGVPCEDVRWVFFFDS